MKHLNTIQSSLGKLLLILAFLSTYSFTINSNDTKKGEALFNAVVSKNIKAVKKMVEKKKADVNYIRRINSSFYTPLLMQAVMDNSTQIATYLISKGADVNSTDGFKMTCLMWSANNGNIELTKLLLENGADKNAEDANGMTALKAAQSKGYKEIAKLLNKN